MGGFRNFAISFTIISILAGCLTSYNVGFEHGADVDHVWLAARRVNGDDHLACHGRDRLRVPHGGRSVLLGVEAGQSRLGLGHRLVQPHWPNAVTAAIGMGLALFGQAFFDFWFSYSEHMDDWFGASFDASTYILYAIFLTAAALVNMLNIRLTSGLNMISAWWHMIGVVVIVAILIIVPNDHQSLSYVFTKTVNNSASATGRRRSASHSSSCSGSGCCSRSTRSRGFRRVGSHRGGTNNASRMAATGM